MAAVIRVLCRACVDIQHGYVGSDKGRTRSPGRIPPSPPTPDRRHSRISNTALYRRCRCHPISEDVKSARWRLFGHVLRMPRHTPAQQAIDYYFADTGVATFRGRPRTSLPTALSADLRRVGRTLRRPADIDALRLLNREQWRQLERDIAEES